MFNESNVKNYDENKLQEVLDNANSIKTLLDNEASALKDFSFSDSRLTEYYDSFLKKMSSGSNILQNTSDVSMKGFINWLSDLIEKLKATIAEVNGIASETPDDPPSDSGVDPPSASADPPSTVDPDSPGGADDDPPSASADPPSTVDPDSPGGADGDTPTPSASVPPVVIPETPSTATPEVEDEQQDPGRINLEELDDTFDAKKTDIQSTDPAEKYYIDKDKWNALSTALQSAIVLQLKKVGYTDNEINDFINGKEGIPKVVLGKIGTALKETLSTHSDLRQVLADKYGFDIFLDNGKIIPSALSALLFMDLKDPNDKYDIIKQLKDDYGVTLVNQDLLKSYKQQLESLYLKDSSIRELILKKYGIDVFNEDGSVNESNLTWVMMMDDADSKDDYDLSKLLKEESEVSVPTPSEEPTEIPVPSDSEEPTEVPVPSDSEEPTEVPVPSDSEEPTEISGPSSSEEPTEYIIPTSTHVDEQEEIVIVPNDTDVVHTSEEVAAPIVGSAVASSPYYSDGYSPMPETIELPTEEVVPTEEENFEEEVSIDNEEYEDLENADDVITRLTPERNQIASIKDEIPLPTKKNDKSGLATIAGLGAAMASAAAGAWMMRNKDENNNDEDDDEVDDEYNENFDGTESINDGDTPIDITPYSSQKDLSAIGMEGASIAADDEELISTGGSNHELPASKEFLNELEVEDENPNPNPNPNSNSNSNDSEFSYYSARQTDLEDSDF